MRLVLPKNATAKILTHFGLIEFSLFLDVAPIAVMNFRRLADCGFYDGLLFHRIIPDFLIQGGDPLTRYPQSRSRWGQGAPSWTIVGESNKHRQVRGALSMARLRDSNSAGSQFFIVLKSLEFLRDSYTVFGKVASSMDVVDKIASIRTDASDAPIETEQARILKVTVAMNA